MGKLRILNSTGHTEVEWSLEEEQALAVKEAERLFNDAKKSGATAFDTSVTPAVKMDKFDPTVGEITVVPRVAGGQ
jgi:hypothetical protein